jgi:hypothetical protein
MITFGVTTMRDRQVLLDKSLKWISEHANATNLDLPDELLNEWIFVEDQEEQNPTGFHVTVFTYGYVQKQTYEKASSGNISIELKQLIELFGHWQLKLALAKMHRRTEITVDPLPLFSFPNGEKARFFTR